ncbi:MAG TPA: hypothetical protein VNW23_08495 [Opitutaceae bacterium]|jgi:hypothetical protein|nr:hypothetical protein [Opitutaceae bacterium]
MKSKLPAQFHQLLPLTEGLIAAAEATAAATRKFQRERRRSLRYTALQPGPDTPLWNELANAAASFLHRRGEKAQLARLLGLPRQRLHLLLVAKTACPDAERTLVLLHWLHSRQRGIKPT